MFALNDVGDEVEFVRTPASTTEDVAEIVDRVHRYAVRSSATAPSIVGAMRMIMPISVYLLG